MDKNLPLLIDKISHLQDAEVSDEEIRRHISQYPRLNPGQILQNAELLINGIDGEKRKIAEKLLGPFIPLTTWVRYKEITIWSEIGEPPSEWASAIMIIGAWILFAMITTICERYESLAMGTMSFLFLLFAETFVGRIERNEWKAKNELAVQIIKDAKELERMLRQYVIE